MNQIATRLLPYMTTGEFLAWPGDGSDRKFELVDGEVRPMPPASVVHGIIQANLAWLLISHLRAGAISATAVTEGAIIPALNASRNVRVPDLVVSPRKDQRDALSVTDPFLLIEILSPGNENATRNNLRAYSTMASVREIMVVHSDRLLVEINRRDKDGAWLPDPEMVYRGGTVRLISIDLQHPVNEFYTDTGLLNQA